jgi:hypothetical protein
MAFTYVTFSAFWTGRYYIIAIDYDSYVIMKHCNIYTPGRKPVLWKHLTFMIYGTKSDTWHISETRLLVTWWLSVHLYVHIEYLGTHSMDLKKMMCEEITNKVEKIHVSLNSEKDNGNFT